MVEHQIISAENPPTSMSFGGGNYPFLGKVFQKGNFRLNVFFGGVKDGVFLKGAFWTFFAGGPEQIWFMFLCVFKCEFELRRLELKKQQ